MALLLLLLCLLQHSTMATSAAESTASSAHPDQGSITIVELGHNSSPLAEEAADRRVTMAQYQTLLKDVGQVDSPLLTRLGYPVIIVSTTPGRKCIPHVRHQHTSARHTVAQCSRFHTQHRARNWVLIIALLLLLLLLYCVQAMMLAVGNNPQNNRMATVAASRITTGLAIGCVVGNVYALRTDGQDLTAEEW